MSTNRYAAPCAVCGARVPSRGGTLTKSGKRWIVKHLACAGDEPGVIEVHSPMTGWTGTQNKRGRCEDAPCCGCCTF